MNRVKCCQRVMISTVKGVVKAESEVVFLSRPVQFQVDVCPSKCLVSRSFEYLLLATRLSASTLVPIVVDC